MSLVLGCVCVFVSSLITAYPCTPQQRPHIWMNELNKAVMTCWLCTDSRCSHLSLVWLSDSVIFCQWKTTPSFQSHIKFLWKSGCWPCYHLYDTSCFLIINILKYLTRTSVFFHPSSTALFRTPHTPLPTSAWLLNLTHCSLMALANHVHFLLLSFDKYNSILFFSFSICKTSDLCHLRSPRRDMGGGGISQRYRKYFLFLK